MLFDDGIPITLYYRLKMDILNDILNGKWKPGDKLPNEFELCEKYDVSRITVRQALAELEKEKYILRKQGKGTFVAIPKIEQNLSSFYSFSEMFKRKGLILHNKILEFKENDLNADLSGNFEKRPGFKAYYIKRLRYAGDTVFALEHTYIPADVFSGINSLQIEKKALYDIMRDDFGIMPDSAEESIGATNITEEDAFYLDIKKGTAVIDIERKTMSLKSCIEFTKSLVRSDIFRFHANLK